MTDQIPPLQPTPGDLVMIFRVALEHLQTAKRVKPNNMGEVLDIAVATKTTLDYWIKITDKELGIPEAQ